MKFEAITIKDIAKALGLSTSTVSRALRDSYEISPETKKLVMEYAEKNNYHPNPIALSLKERRSRSIGVIVCEIANSFFSQTINGIESIAYNSGYNVIISQSRESADRELMNLQYLTSRSVDGLIVSVSTGTQDFTYLKELKERGMPIVFFDRIVDEIETHKVMVDNFRGAKEATQHLIDSGYKNIAHISNVPVLSIARERLAGYKAALQENGMPVREDMVRHCLHGGMIVSEVETAVNELLQMKPAPDAFITSSDKLTTNCFRILKAKGIRIPDEMGLIGFSNSELTELLDPPLSVIRQPAFEMGEIATSMLIKLIESKRPVTEFETRMLGTELLIRGSSRRTTRKKKEMA